MKEITKKTLLITDVFIGAVHDQLWQYDRTRLGKPRPCSYCGSRQYRKDGYQERTFAQLITDEGFEWVIVNVQLYECTNCGSRFQGGIDISELFYKDCRYNKSLVDLSLFHTAENQYSLQVDQDTIQHYTERVGDTVADHHGFA